MSKTKKLLYLELEAEIQYLLNNTRKRISEIFEEYEHMTEEEEDGKEENNKRLC